jgi:hypothetical protein
MAAEVVGTAFVRIRALTTGLAKDIERGVDRGARAANIDASAGVVGDNFARAAGEKIKEGIGDAVADSTKNVDRKVDVDGGRRAGDRLAESLKRGLSRSMDNLGKLGNRLMAKLGWDEAGGQRAGKKFGRGMRGMLVKLAVLFAPAIFGLGSAILQYAVALTAQIGLLFQAAAGAGLALGGAAAAGALALIPLILAFTTASPALDRFKMQAAEIAGRWKEVGAATQETLLPGLIQALRHTEVLIPIFRAWGREVGRIVGSQAEFLSAVMASEEGQRRWRSILQQSSPVVETMGRIVITLGDLLSRLFEAVLPISLQFVEALEVMVARWRDVLAASAESGSLAITLQDWYDKSVLVGGAVADLFAAIWNILMVGGDSAVPFFENFATWAQEFRDWTASLEGQNRLAQIFDDSLEVAHEFHDLIVTISRTIGSAVFEPGGNEGIIGFMHTLRDDIVPFLDILVREMRDTYGPALNDFFAAFGDLLLALSDAGSLNVTLALLTGVLDALTLTLLTLLSIPGFDKFIGTLLGLAAAFKVLKMLGVVALVGKIVTALGSLTGLAVTIGGVFGATGLGAAVIGFGAIIAVVAVVAGAIALLVIHWDSLKAAFAAVVRFMKDPMARLERLDEIMGNLARTIGGAFMDAWGAVLGFLGNLGTSIGGALAGAFGTVQSTVADAFGSVSDIVEEALEDALEAVSRWPGNVVRFLSGLGTTIITALVKGLKALPGALMTALTTAATFALEAMRATLHRLIQAVLIVIFGIPILAFQALAFLGPKLIEAFSTAFSALVAAIPGLISAIISFFQQLPGNIAMILSGLAAAALGALSNLAGALSGFFTGTVWPAVTGAVSAGINNVMQFFRDLPGNIVGAVSSIASLVNGVFSSAFAVVKETVRAGIDALVQFFRDLPGRILSAAATLGETLLAIGSTIVSKLLEGLGAAPGAIANLATRMFDAVRDLGKFLINGIIDALNQLLPNEIGGVTQTIAGRNITILPSIPLPDNPIPRLARGAIVSKATAAIVGEAGREVVIPLTNPRRALQLFHQSGLAAVLAKAQTSRSGLPSAPPGGGSGLTIEHLELHAEDVRSVFRETNTELRSIARGLSNR